MPSILLIRDGRKPKMIEITEFLNKFGELRVPEGDAQIVYHPSGFLYTWLTETGVSAVEMWSPDEDRWLVRRLFLEMKV